MSCSTKSTVTLSARIAPRTRSMSANFSSAETPLVGSARRRPRAGRGLRVAEGAPHEGAAAHRDDAEADEEVFVGAERVEHLRDLERPADPEPGDLAGRGGGDV